MLFWGTRPAAGAAAGVDSRASRRSRQMRNASPTFYPLLALGDFSRQQINSLEDEKAGAVGGPRKMKSPHPFQGVGATGPTGWWLIPVITDQSCCRLLRSVLLRDRFRRQAPGRNDLQPRCKALQLPFSLDKYLCRRHARLASLRIQENKNYLHVGRGGWHVLWRTACFDHVAEDQFQSRPLNHRHACHDIEKACAVIGDHRGRNETLSQLQQFCRESSFVLSSCVVFSLVTGFPSLVLPCFRNTAEEIRF